MPLYQFVTLVLFSAGFIFTMDKIFNLFKNSDFLDEVIIPALGWIVVTIAALFCLFLLISIVKYMWMNVWF